MVSMVPSPRTNPGAARGFFSRTSYIMGARGCIRRQRSKGDMCRQEKRNCTRNGTTITEMRSLKSAPSARLQQRPPTPRQPA